MKEQIRTDRQSNRGHFIGSSDARIIVGNEEAVFLRPWRDMRDDFRLGVGPEEPNRRRYEAITDRMPSGWHVVAVCYATAAIFLGWWPWNLLLLMLLFPIRNERVRFLPLRTVAAKQSMGKRES